MLIAREKFFVKLYKIYQSLEEIKTFDLINNIILMKSRIVNNEF